LQNTVVAAACEVASLRESVESGQGLVGERNVADAAARGGALHRSGERAFDNEHALGPADVVPPGRDELASPQAAVRGHPQELAELAVLVTQRFGDLGRFVGPGDPPCAGLRCASDCFDLLDSEDLDPAGAVLAALGVPAPGCRRAPTIALVGAKGRT
jgi:hypothetical protein